MGDLAASAPRVHPNLDTAWWWDALARGELQIPACRTCDHRFFPPQAFCPKCGSPDWAGVPVSGSGIVYSWVVTHYPFAPDVRDEVPYANIAVDLDEGGRLIGRFLGDPAVLRADLGVKAEPYTKGSDTLLGFKAES